MRKFLTLWLILPFLSSYCIAQSEGIRLTGVNAFDQGEVSGDGIGDLSLDLVQDVCDVVDTQTIVEPFFDTLIGIDVTNSATMDAQVTRVRYAIRRLEGKRVFRSAPLSPTGSPLILANDSSRIFAFFLRAQSGAKLLPGGSAALNPSLGIKKVRIILKGKLADGTRFRRRIRTSLHFGNMDRCQ